VFLPQPSLPGLHLPHVFCLSHRLALASVFRVASTRRSGRWTPASRPAWSCSSLPLHIPAPSAQRPTPAHMLPIMLNTAPASSCTRCPRDARKQPPDFFFLALACRLVELLNVTVSSSCITVPALGSPKPLLPTAPAARYAVVLELALLGKLIQRRNESNINKVLTPDGNSSVNPAFQGHCTKVFIGV
jgi:hypothetical protein